MTFPNDDGGYAIVTSLKCEHVNQKVYNLKFEQAYYECLQLQRGNICKHQIKVLMFLHLDLVKGTIACYSSSLSETFNGGLNNMFNPCPIITPFSQQTLRTNPTPQSTKDLEKNICDPYSNQFRMLLKIVCSCNIYWLI